MIPTSCLISSIVARRSGQLAKTVKIANLKFTLTIGYPKDTARGRSLPLSI
jgi:hypothetical protein